MIGNEFGEEDSMDISISIIRSARKTISIEVHRDGSVVVRAPYRMPESKIMEFVSKEAKWIADKQKKIRENPPLPQIQIQEQDSREMREKAKKLCEQRVAYYAPRMGVTDKVGVISVRNQKTRWGSCSGKGNLSFNWKLVVLPKELSDYVVVHELAHLKQMNHSPAFWKEVEKILPDYQERRQELAKFR